MEISWIKSFCISAETLNFRKTSELLHMSQPNVTVHIRKLEEELGVSLFIRKQNRVHLTPEGQLFYSKAKLLLKDLAESVQSVQSLSQGFKRTWTLAISPLMAETILPSILRRFVKEHPEVELRIQVEESVQIEGLVLNGDVDFGISALPATSKKIHEVQLFSEHLHFVKAPDSYDEESGPALDLREVLQSETLFTHHHPAIWDDLLVKLTHLVPGIRSLKVSQASVTKRFVQDGLGVSLLPHSIVRRELLEGRLMSVPFELFDLPKVSTYAMMKQQDALSEAFLSVIRRSYFG